jgi:hypothetical protein
MNKESYMRPMFLSLYVAFALAVGVTMSNFGCSEADAAFDCYQVCNKYKTCFNSSYDVKACTDRCREAASKDNHYKDKADICETCIDDRSCVSATFSCATECGGIVP